MPCKQRPSVPVSGFIYAPAKVFLSFYPVAPISPSRVTLSRKTESQRHPISIVRVVVVAVAVVVHITEVRCVVRRPQPPIVARRSAFQRKTYTNYFMFLYRSLSFFSVPFTSLISFSTNPIQYLITFASSPKIS